MKVYMISEEDKQSYKGGISSILDGYFSNSDLFNGNGYEIIRINPFTFKKTNCRFFNKILNLFRIPSENRKIMKILKNETDNFIIHFHSGYGFVLFKSLIYSKKIYKKFKNKIFFSIHFADYPAIFSKNKIIKKIETNYLNKYIYKVILLSTKTRDDFIQNGFSNDKFEVLYTFHNYNNEVFYPFEQNDNIFKILFMGSIDERKGILDLLDSLKTIWNIYNIQLFVCGSRNDDLVFKKFTSVITNPPFDSFVYFKGYVSGEEKINILQSSDIFVLPSYGEGMPVSILEAMFFGCAVVATNVGSIPEIISSKNGYLIKPGDINQLSRCLTNLLSNRKELEAIKRYNHQYASNFTVRANIMNLLRIYKK